MLTYFSREDAVFKLLLSVSSPKMLMIKRKGTELARRKAQDGTYETGVRPALQDDGKMIRNGHNWEFGLDKTAINRLDARKFRVVSEKRAELLQVSILEPT